MAAGTRNKTAQFAQGGDILKRKGEDGEMYRFRVRRGGNASSSDNVVVYLDNPEERRIDPEVYFNMEENEATILYWEDEEGNLHSYDPA